MKHYYIVTIKAGLYEDLPNGHGINPSSKKTFEGSICITGKNEQECEEAFEKFLKKNNVVCMKIKK